MIRRRPILLLLLASTVSLEAFAGPLKAVQLYEDLQHPKYWKEHVITLAEVTGPSADGRVPIKVIEQFSDGPSLPETLELSLQNIDLISADPLRPADRILVIRDRDTKMAFDRYLVIKDGKFEEQVRLADTCRSIGKLRDVKDLSRLVTTAMNSADTRVEQYMLHALIDEDEATLPDAVIEQVEKIRADVGNDMQVRMLANRLLEFVADARRRRSDHWAWMVQTLREERGHTFSEYLPLIEQLSMPLQTLPRQVEALALFCEIANDPARPIAQRAAILRNASFSAFLNKELPDDPGNARIFNTLNAQVRDPSLQIKIPAMSSLAGLIDYLVREDQLAYARQEAARAVASLDAVIADEKSPDARKREQEFRARIAKVEGK
jgi:hypothetical protein